MGFFSSMIVLFLLLFPREYVGSQVAYKETPTQLRGTGPALMKLEKERKAANPLAKVEVEVEGSAVPAPLPEDSSHAITCPKFEGRWLLGETGVAGLCNQMAGVFGYARIAQLVGAKGLVLGPLYSRSSFGGGTFAGTEAEGCNCHVLGFDDFFDIDHYTHFWAQQNLTVLTLNTFNTCIKQAGLLDDSSGSFNYTDVVRPRFWPFSNKEILELVENSMAVSSPEIQAGGFHVLRITGHHFVALYNFHADDPTFQGADNINLRMAIESLKPAPDIQKAIDGIMVVLPTNYTGIHLRVEADVLYDLESTRRSVDMYIENILRTIEDPEHMLFVIASGVFQGDVDPERREIVEKAFNASSLTITHRAKLTAESSEETQEIMARLLPEQLALVDLQILRYSEFFQASNETGSSFTYTAQRLRDVDKGDAFRLDNIPESSRFMFSWGYRK